MCASNEKRDKYHLYFLSDFHFLPRSYVFVTLFSGISTKISHLGHFEHGFTLV
jgi:hypothetical protein